MNAIHDLLPGGKDNSNLVVSLTIEIGGELKKVRDHRGADRSIGVTPTRPPETISDTSPRAGSGEKPQRFCSPQRRTVAVSLPA